MHAAASATCAMHLCQILLAQTKKGHDWLEPLQQDSV